MQQPIITAAAMSHDLINARALCSLVYFARDVQTHLTYFCCKHQNSSLCFQVPKVSERLVIPVTCIGCIFVSSYSGKGFTTLVNDGRTEV